MQKRLNIFDKGSELRSLTFFLFLLLIFSSLTACSKTKENPPWEYMPNMIDNLAVKAFREPGRMPVAGTFPQGYIPYPFTKDEGDKAGVELQNPLSYTLENFQEGQALYDVYCIVCHGPKGQGDGTIVPKFPRPPTLLSDKVRAWSDGRLYHVMTMGQNLMPSYATQIKPQDRWAIALYMRALQRATKPTPEDVEAVKKALKEGKF